VLGVTRVQHGVRAVEDTAVMALAAERGVVFDVCPVSNVKLGVAASLEAHPLRALMAAGVRCTVSTDDPLVFGLSLNEEYAALAEAGYSREELRRLARNGFEVALLPEREKADWIAKIETIS
jgi:adenosine deaminase